MGLSSWLATAAIMAATTPHAPFEGAAEASALPTVVVSATRVPSDALLVPAAIDVIAGVELRRAQPAISLAETLQRVPGVVARDRQNQAQDLQVSIRGFGARASFGVRGIRMLTDGIPATMPDGQGQVSHFTLDAADRIEVLRGPFSALHGNAAGGVIEIFSAPAPPVPEAGIGLVLGQDDLEKSTLSWHGPVGDAGNHGLLFDANRSQSDGYRRQSRWRRDGVQALARGSFGKTSYTVLLNGLDLQADDPQGLNAAELAGDRRAPSPNSLLFDSRKSVRQSQAGLRLEREAGDHARLSLVTYRGQRRTAQILTVPVFAQANPLHGGGAIDLDRDYSGFDARAQWTLSLLARPLTLTVGAQAERADETRRGNENFIGSRLGVVGALRRQEDNSVSSVDPYVQAQWQASSRWNLNAGIRHSRVRFRSVDHYVTATNPDDSGSLAYSNTSPVLGVLFRATPWLSVYANAGKGFETPTLSELAYRADGNSGLNDALRAARSRSFETGVRARRNGMEFSAAVFDTHTRDELVVLANAGGRSVFGNAGTSRRRGVELAWSTNLDGRWHLAASYTLLDAAYTSDFSRCITLPCAANNLLIARGRRIPGLSRHFAWTQLRWSASTDLDVILESRFVGSVPVDDANSARAPAYSSSDLAVERRWTLGKLQWRGFARINNVFDRDIIGSVIVNESNGRYYEPAPGRNWMVGLSASRSFD